VAEIVRDRDPNAARRRNTRVAQALPIIVRGWNAEGRAFEEHTSTISINCYGCRFQSKHGLSNDTWVFLEVPHRVSGRAPRKVRARVTYVTRPRSDHERYQIGVELETHGNIWGMAFPPADWFPYPETREEASRTAPPDDAGPSKLKIVNQTPAAAPAASSSGLTASEGEAQDSNEIAQQVAHIVAEAKRQIEKEVASYLRLVAETQRKILDQELESAVKRAFLELDKRQESTEARAKEAGDAAIEDFKKRLENVANSWLVTTAAILNERAQNTFAALAKATEDRLRDRSE
jgi:hypothetical protein